MSINTLYKTNTIDIEDYINWNESVSTMQNNSWNGGVIERNSPIINVICMNGIQPFRSNRKLMELYPGLFDACMEHFKMRNHSTVFVYTEEGKPPVWNMFILEPTSLRHNDRNKLQNARNYIRQSGQYRFAYISEERNNCFKDSVKKISDTMRNGYSYKFYAFNPKAEQIEINVEEVPY